VAVRRLEPALEIAATLRISPSKGDNVVNFRSQLGTVLFSLMLFGSMHTLAWAHNTKARPSRIVGVWDVQVTNYDCRTGVPLAAFRGLHKYELGGTAQVVPATNPAVLSSHVGVWRHIQGNKYRLTFKMFRFDLAGNNVGWNVVKFDVALNEDGTAEAGSGQAEVFDSNGNSLATNCPAFTGTRFSQE